MPTAITPHGGGSAPDRLGALKGGVAALSGSGAPNGGMSAQSKYGALRGRYIRSQRQTAACVSTNGTPLYFLPNLCLYPAALVT